MALKVVITDCPWEDNSIERGILEEAGLEVARAQCSTAAQVLAACKDADVLLVGWAPIPADVVPELKRCRLMMRYGTGYNNINVDAAAAAGIAVAINSEYCVEEVAEHTLSLLLACHRQLSVLAHAVRRGVWDPMATMTPTQPLSKKKLGILGFGKIGRRLGSMVRLLVARVLVHDPLIEKDAADFPGFEFVSLDRLLSESDYLSVHAPLNPQTDRLFSSQNLGKMKPSAWLVNCSRGPIVDEEALVEALRSGQIAGAALDVFHVEPLPMDHPLRSFPNVIITPHAAWYSEQANYLLRAYPARAIVRFPNGEPIPLVNEPVQTTVQGTGI
jgi:D-3-phosphoglycerate dehydrogenase